MVKHSACLSDINIKYLHQLIKIFTSITLIKIFKNFESDDL